MKLVFHSIIYNVKNKKKYLTWVPKFNDSVRKRKRTMNKKLCALNRSILSGKTEKNKVWQRKIQSICSGTKLIYKKGI